MVDRVRSSRAHFWILGLCLIFSGLMMFFGFVHEIREWNDFRAMDAATATAGAEPGLSDHQPALGLNSRFDLAGRTWTMAFQTSRAFEESSSLLYVPLMGVIGLGTSLAAFFLTRSLVRAGAKAEAQRNDLRSLFTQAPAAIAILRGPELRYELSNPLNEELGGHRHLEGKTVREALPELADQGLVEILDRVYRSGEPFVGREVPLTLDTPGAGPRHLYLNGVYQPIRDPAGAVEGIMAFAYDVTEQVVARQQVEALAEDLTKAVRVRDEFLSIAGHELKTPLAALKLQLQSLHRHARRDDLWGRQEKLLERFEKAESHLLRLERLVSELLDVSRITAGHLTLQVEEVDLSALLGEIVDRFGEPLARAGCRVEVRLEGDARGVWDRGRLDQVITNLLSNAIKYGRGKPIEVSVESVDGVTRLKVRDHGIGISPEDRERIFARFERAVSDRHYGGLGLGLWITHQIVRAHGGHISLESHPGEGSAFTVELPRRALQEPERAEAAEPTEAVEAAATATVEVTA